MQRWQIDRGIYRGERREDKGKILLTGSNNSSSAGAGLCATSTQSEDEAQPAKSHLTAAAVEVRNQGAGSLELTELASVRRVTDGKDGLEPARTGRDGTTVHPDVEAGTATVRTIATLANTTERQSRDMQSGIVAGDTTGASARQN